MKIDALIAKLETQKQQLAKVTLQLAKMYVRKTGKTLDEIINLMKQQTWLTADEAKGWGFVDEYSIPRQLQENGAFYQDAGQNKKRILSMLSQGRQITNLATPIKTDDTIFRLANAVLTGELAMKPGKKLFKMYITDETGEFMIEPGGELDGKLFVTYLTVFHPGLKDTLFGFINEAKNDNLLFVVQDSDGQNTSWVTSFGQLYMRVLRMDLAPVKKQQPVKGFRWSLLTRLRTCISIPGIFL